MKHNLKKTALFFLMLAIFATAFAQEKASKNSSKQGSTTQKSNSVQNSQQKEKVSFFKDGKIPYVIFDEGPSFTQVRRTVKQANRSNFNFVDSLIGAECTMRTRNFEPLDMMLRLAIYYPISTGFNEHYVKPALLVQGGIDLFWGLEIKLSMWDLVVFHITPGLHGLFQVNDRFTYFNGGGGVYLNFELPIAYRWTIIAGGLFTIDYGNWGTNKGIEPYDFVWQYQIELAVRYTKKDVHLFNYTGQTAQTVKDYDEKQAAKKAEKEAKKLAQKEAREASKQTQENFSDEDGKKLMEHQKKQKAAHAGTTRNSP